MLILLIVGIGYVAIYTTTGRKFMGHDEHDEIELSGGLFDHDTSALDMEKKRAKKKDRAESKAVAKKSVIKKPEPTEVSDVVISNPL